MCNPVRGRQHISKPAHDKNAGAPEHRLSASAHSILERYPDDTGAPSLSAPAATAIATLQPASPRRLARRDSVLVACLAHVGRPDTTLVIARLSRRATSYPGLAISMSAVHAGPKILVGGPSDARPTNRVAAQALHLRQIPERARFPFAAIARVAPVASLAVVKAAGWKCADPAADNFFPAVRPAFPVDRARAPVVDRARTRLARAGPGSAAALPHHAAGSGSTGSPVPAVAPDADIDSRNIAAGRKATEPATVLNCDSSCPIRVAAVPTNCPSAHPSAAAHPNATRESTREVAGNTGQGRAV